MAALIRLLDVSYSYDEDDIEKKALKNISLEFSEGEFVGVVGRNGSGKSTLAKMLNGLLLPTQGEVMVLGMNTSSLEDITAIRKSVGMVFQNPDNQMIATVVEEDVAFGVENLGLPPEEIREAVEYGLAAVGMSEYRDKRPNQLSGGQKQRIAIAGVLAMRPKCIIFDESTAMLDPTGRRELIQTMHELKEREGVTVILITHYMEELIGVDRIVAMDDGQVAFVKTPVEAFADEDALHALQLSAPAIVEIAHGLQKAGLSLPDGLLSAEELVEAICQLK